MSQFISYYILFYLGLSMLSSVECINSKYVMASPPFNSTSGFLSFLDENNVALSQYGSLAVSGFGLLFSFIALIMVIQVKRQVRKARRPRKEKTEMKNLNHNHLSTISEVDYAVDEFDQV
uniref:Uncharacterized protein n=1 Tax=Tetranychus urticae TaxID=32264 RepID=T1JSA2_TETUR